MYEIRTINNTKHIKFVKIKKSHTYTQQTHNKHTTKGGNYMKTTKISFY